jgi:GH24 family phage-related lysozyme (muramidase)
MSDIEDMLNAQEGTGPMRDGRYFPYQDSEGIWTIGHGHNLEAKGIPADIEQMLYRGDIADALDDIRYCCSCYDQLSRPRQLVMVSLAFNLGRVRLAKFVRFLGALHLGHWDEAADQIIDSAAWRNPKLRPRYQQLADMMRNNVSIWV